jgi:N-acetylglucosamine malate deacetylase 2
MKRFPAILFVVTIALHAIAARAQDTAAADVRPGHPIRALLIVAHPDDEYEMAGTIYRITNELSGTVDQIIITDGEAGYRYSSLAARYYGVNLTDETTGRAKLPRIREEEARRAGRILGIRRQWFLNERDDHFTLDVEDALKSWRSERILAELSEHLQKERYDVVFVLLPAPDTHGQHKAASILALEAVEKLPANQRPAVVAADAAPTAAESYRALPGYPVTATNSSEPQFHFDRDVHFGFRDSLSYEIVVDWVIAEHKSQGLFQTKCGQDRFENFWVFALSGGAGANQAAALFDRISRQSQTAGPAAIVPAAKAQ